MQTIKDEYKQFLADAPSHYIRAIFDEDYSGLPPFQNHEHLALECEKIISLMHELEDEIPGLCAVIKFFNYLTLQDTMDHGPDYYYTKLRVIGITEAKDMGDYSQLWFRKTYQKIIDIGDKLMHDNQFFYAYLANELTGHSIGGHPDLAKFWLGYVHELLTIPACVLEIFMVLPEPIITSTQFLEWCFIHDNWQGIKSIILKEHPVNQISPCMCYPDDVCEDCDSLESMYYYDCEMDGLETFGWRDAFRVAIVTSLINIREGLLDNLLRMITQYRCPQIIKHFPFELFPDCVPYMRQLYDYGFQNGYIAEIQANYKRFMYVKPNFCSLDQRHVPLYSAKLHRRSIPDYLFLFSLDLIDTPEFRLANIEHLVSIKINYGNANLFQMTSLVVDLLDAIEMDQMKKVLVYLMEYNIFYWPFIPRDLRESFQEIWQEKLGVMTNFFEILDAYEKMGGELMEIICGIKKFNRVINKGADTFLSGSIFLQAIEYFRGAKYLAKICPQLHAFLLQRDMQQDAEWFAQVC